jgi:SAM-dependent methyltransferase
MFDKDTRDVTRYGATRPKDRAMVEKTVQELREELEEKFARYRTSQLRSITVKEFTGYIHSRLGAMDPESEGYRDDELERQRDLSIRFHWGHDHDFGDFALKGRMGTRHIDVLANLAALFPISLEDFQDKRVLDIGCWTGGTALLLAALGADVLAIEEVHKYADMASFLAKAFGVGDRVAVKAMSLYDCNSPDYYHRFDIAFFPGVIYHLSDPVLALRIVFNALKVGGIALIESAGIDSREPICRFEGSLVHHNPGCGAQLSRSGWNWFIPSPVALDRMMREAGFDDSHAVWHPATHRIYAYARKRAQVGICKAGLSVPPSPRSNRSKSTNWSAARTTDRSAESEMIPPTA